LHYIYCLNLNGFKFYQMSSNKKTVTALSVLACALVSALVMPLVVLMSACVCTHKEPKAKKQTSPHISKKKQSTA
jgi:hypothetical protein